MKLGFDEVTLRCAEMIECGFEVTPACVEVTHKCADVATGIPTVTLGEVDVTLHSAEVTQLFVLCGCLTE